MLSPRRTDHTTDSRDGTAGVRSHGGTGAPRWSVRAEAASWSCALTAPHSGNTVGRRATSVPHRWGTTAGLLARRAWKSSWCRSCAASPVRCLLLHAITSHEPDRPAPERARVVVGDHAVHLTCPDAEGDSARLALNDALDRDRRVPVGVRGPGRGSDRGRHVAPLPDPGACRSGEPTGADRTDPAYGAGAWREVNSTAGGLHRPRGYAVS